MNRAYVRVLEQLLKGINRKFKDAELADAAEALNDALGSRGEDIDLELAARVLDGMFYEGFLLLCPRRVIFLHRQPIGGLWYHKSWRFSGIRDVSKAGPGSFAMSVEEDGERKRLKFFIDIRDYDRLEQFIDTIQERRQ